MDKLIEGVKSVLVGIGLSLLLFFGGIALLVYNEYTSVQHIIAYNEAQKVAVDIDSASVSPENEGKLVCASGQLDVVSAEVVDTDFGVGMKTAKMQRAVEMYQWSEEKNDDTYEYKAQWESYPIDSSSYNDNSKVNPAMPYSDKIFTADDVKLAAFTLAQPVKENMTATKEITPTSQALPNGYAVSGRYVTNSQDLASPQVGDVRVSYMAHTGDVVSVLAKQSGQQLTAYTTKNNIDIQKSVDSIMTAEQVVNVLKDENNATTWLLRGIGVGLIIFGLVCFLGLATSVTRFIPIVGSIVGGAVFVVSIILGLAVGILTIALSWIVVRPLLGAGLLVASLAIMFVLRKFLGRLKAANPQGKIVATQ